MYRTLAILMTLQLACSGEPAPAPGEAAAPASAELSSTATESKDTGEIGMAAAVADDRSRDTSSERVAARHILVTYRGAQGAGPSIHRSREDARALAEQHLQRLQTGIDLGTLAFEVSDDGSAPMRGMLGAFGRGVMDPTFEKTVFGLGEGEISGIVETPFGFHIIERLGLEEVRLGQVLVQYEGASQSKVSRTKEEAAERARAAHARLVAGDPLTDVARELSDGPMGVYGGDLGWMQRGQMQPDFDERAFELEIGETTEVFESRLGYHVLVRLE